MRQAAYLTLLTDSEVIAPSVESTTDETATDSPTDPPAPPTVAPTAPPAAATEAPVAERVDYQGPPDAESSGESAETDSEITVDLSGPSPKSFADLAPTVLTTTDFARTEPEDTTVIETTVTSTPAPTTTTAAPKPLATDPSLPVS